MKGPNSKSGEEYALTIGHFTRYVKIAHHIPGRIRLRIPFLSLIVSAVTDLSQRLNSVPGILRTRISPDSESVVVEYDERLLPYDLWEEIRAIEQRPDLALEIAERFRVLWEH